MQLINDNFLVGGIFAGGGLDHINTLFEPLQAVMELLLPGLALVEAHHQPAVQVV